jgi:hypothetical protein
MGVVRIDDKLLVNVKELLAKDENKYKYGSISSYINLLIYEKLKKEGIKK